MVTALPLLAIWSRSNPPPTREAFEALKGWAPDELRAAGLVRWDHADPAGFTLWLFPAPWFYAIPGGLEVTSIMGNTGAWEAGAASKDQRAGCIAYGFRISHRVAS